MPLFSSWSATRNLSTETIRRPASRYTNDQQVLASISGSRMLLSVFKDRLLGLRFMPTSSTNGRLHTAKPKQTSHAPCSKYENRRHRAIAEEKMSKLFSFRGTCYLLTLACQVMVDGT